MSNIISYTLCIHDGSPSASPVSWFLTTGHRAAVRRKLVPAKLEFWTLLSVGRMSCFFSLTSQACLQTSSGPSFAGFSPWQSPQATLGLFLLCFNPDRHSEHLPSQPPSLVPPGPPSCLVCSLWPLTVGLRERNKEQAALCPLNHHSCVSQSGPLMMLRRI